VSSAPVAEPCARESLASAPSAGSSSFLRNSVVFGSVSFGAYLFSLVKTVVVTHYFGTSAEMDGFAAAVMVPNLLGALLAGSASAGLVPALAAAERESAQRRADTYRTSCVILVGGCAVASAALAFLGRQVVHLVAPAFSGSRLLIAERLAPAASLLLLLAGIYAFASAEMLSRKKYVAVAAAPAISTVLSLLGILMFHSRGAAVLVWALVAGMAVQALMVSVPAWLASAGGRLTHWHEFHVARALSTQLALLAVSSIGVTNSFVDQVIASLLPTGNLSALTYASSLNGVSMQVIIMSMGWIALPQLAELVAAQDISRLRQKVRLCVITVVMMAAPACLLIAGLGQTGIRVLFEHGRFSSESTRLVYLAWAGYSLGLVPASIGMMASRVANALHENWLLFRVGIALLIVNAVLDYALMRAVGLPGITLSTSIVYCFSCVLLYRSLHARVGEILDHRTLRRIARVAAAAALAAIPAAALRMFAGSGPIASALLCVLFLAGLAFAYQRAGVIAWHIPPRPDWRPWHWVNLSLEES
jgi:putative peptidoglycan lipid II flippase